MGKGSNTTSSNSTSSPDPQAYATYQSLLQRASGVASTPYQAYTGELTAPVNSQQQVGISGINTNAGYANPFIQGATGLAAASSSPLSAGQISQYMNPYTQSVVNSSLAQMQDTDAQQMASLQGNQIAQGALGGNATGVAKGILGGQQALANNSTIAGLYSRNYSQALAAAQQQQQTGLAGANAIANFGLQGQNAALTGANAQINAGNLIQNTQQQADTANYGQYQQAQAYPYQQAQWLAGIDTGVGSQMGGTSTGQTTGPSPNQTGQYLGAGLAAAGLFLSDERAKEDIEEIGKTHDGQKLYRYRYKGSPHYQIGLIAQEVEHRHPDDVAQDLGGMRYVDIKGATDDAVRRADGGGVGGTPWSGAQGWIPTIGIHGGSGAPQAHAPNAPSQQQPNIDYSKIASTAQGLGNAMSGPQWGGGNLFSGDAYGGSSSSPLEGLDASDYGVGFARGGGVAGYAAGGSPDLPEWLGDGNFNDIDAQALARDAAASRGPVPGADMSFEDRAAPTVRAIQAIGSEPGFDPRGQNYDTFQGAPAMQVANSGRVPLPMARPDGAGARPAPDDDEEDDTPTGVGRAVGAPQGVASAYARQPGATAGLPSAITNPGATVRDDGSQPGFGLGLLSRNAQTGLLTAGLSMLASRSPFLGNTIGEGGLAGFNAYGAGVENDRKAAAEAAKLQREAEATQFSNTMALRKQTETERHDRESEKDKTPAGYQVTKDGLQYIPGGPADPDQVAKIANAKAKMAPGSNIDPDTADFLADRLRVGDNKALTGLGHGLQGSNNILEVQRRAAARSAAGIPIMDSARDMQSNTAANAGLVAAERAQAGIMARLSVYGRSAYNAADLALETSNEFPRTSFPKVNAAIAAYRSNTGDPGIKAFGQAVTTLANEYARAVGGGHGTVHQQEQAELRLSETQSPEQFAATVNLMKREIALAEHAMPAARQQIREIYAPTSRGSTTSIEGTSNPTATAQGFNGAPPTRPANPEVGKVYDTPRGRLMWNGNGWIVP